MSQRTTVFVSYSHRDSRWLERLQVHLRPIARRGDLALWDDTRIAAGERWRPAIRAAIARAAASVLLISADFLASDFIASEELPALLLRAEKAGARVLPIIVQPCRLSYYPALACFQALNPPSRPLSKLSDADAEDVFVRAAEQIEKVLSPTQAHAVRTRTRPKAEPSASGASAETFDDLQSRTVALSILVRMVSEDGQSALTLSELTRALNIRSRRLAYDAVDRLEKAGWIDKRRVEGRTVFRSTPEGVRQMRRLAASADGPLRRAVPPR